MTNLKKSRNGIVILTIIVAFILCFFAPIYTFATSRVDINTPVKVNDTLDLLNQTKIDIDLTAENIMADNCMIKDTNHINNQSNLSERKIEWDEIPGETFWSDEYGEVKWLTFEDYAKVVRSVGMVMYIHNGTIRPCVFLAEENDKILEKCKSIGERLMNGKVQIIITKNRIATIDSEGNITNI